jgi:rhodanese-related sulfurtransferase
MASNFKNIGPRQLQERLAASTDIVLLDVREADEREISKLPNDVHISMGEIAGRLSELDLGAEIVVYCRTGNRSGRVAEYMAQAGFQNVSNLAGGINLWAREIDPSLPTY